MPSAARRTVRWHGVEAEFAPVRPSGISSLPEVAACDCSRYGCRGFGPDTSVRTSCGLQGLMVEPYFNVRTEPAHNGCVQIVLAGEVDLATHDVLFRAAADTMLKIRPGDVDMIEVDLAGVSLLDAASIGVLLAVEKLARDRGIQLRIRGATGLPLQALEITGALTQLGGKSGTVRPSSGPEAPR